MLNPNERKPVMHLRLETRVKCCEEWMFCRQRQYASFSHSALNVIVFNDYMFLQHFYRKQFCRMFMLC